MESIINEKFKDLKLVWEILNPLPRIGYGKDGRTDHVGIDSGKLGEHTGEECILEFIHPYL